MKANRNKTRTKLAAGRAAPDIPAEIPLLTAGDTFSGPEVVVRDCILQDLALIDYSFRSVVIEGCILKRVSFARSKLNGLRLKDVRLVECDFANAEVTGLKAVRVEFVNCRLTGLRAIEAECQDFLVCEGDAGYSQFRFGTFKTSEFNTCNFGEADFHGSDLRGALLKRCEFTNVDYDHNQTGRSGLSRFQRGRPCGDRRRPQGSHCRSGSSHDLRRTDRFEDSLTRPCPPKAVERLPQ
jgi:hypothetical protein